MNYKLKAQETASHLTGRLPEPPRVGIMAGTGLGDIAGSLAGSIRIAYADLPHFPESTVQSHRGQLVAGRMGAQPALVMQGRFHLYEGYTPLEVTFPVRVMQELGIRVLIVTNAAGGFNPSFAPGDIMILTDHINLTGENPLVGRNEDGWGLRFPDMSRVYDPELARLAEAGAAAHGITVHKGIYAGLKGPSLETPAEVRFLKIIGADAVGFSTVQEVIAGVHGAMRILGLSTITNVNDPDRPQPATVEDIIQVAERAAPRLEAIITHVLASLEAL